MPFVAALWTAILVALLCAVAPDGPPSSKPTGSAFNPANIAVVLKARSLPVPQIARAVRPDGDGVALPWLIAATLSPLALWRLLPAAPLPSAAYAPTPARVRPMRGARAPPVPI